MATQSPFHTHDLLVPDGAIAVVAARFNQEVIDRLLQGAQAAFNHYHIPKENTPVFQVAGAFEVPLMVKKLALSRRYSAIVALGAVIRGETAHFDFVAAQCAAGIMQVMLETEIPVSFGVLTTDTVAQALVRSEGIGPGNKGYEAALTALEMISLIESLSK